MLFHKWDKVFDCKTPLYIMVDNNYNYRNSEHKFIKDFNSLNIQTLSNIKDSSIDFIDNLHPNLLLYIVYFRNKKSTKLENKIYLFKKNKLYFFEKNNSWWDEIGNELNPNHDHGDIWYDPFLFIHEKDIDQAIRYLKLNNLGNIS